jgi:hypothetical protein
MEREYSDIAVDPEQLTDSGLTGSTDAEMSSDGRESSQPGYENPDWMDAPYPEATDTSNGSRGNSAPGDYSRDTGLAVDSVARTLDDVPRTGDTPMDTGHDDANAEAEWTMAHEAVELERALENEARDDQVLDRVPEIDRSETEEIRETIEDSPKSPPEADTLRHVVVDDNTELKFGELEPDTVYEKNGYTFTTDSLGRTVSVTGVLSYETGRRSAEQTRVGHLGVDGDEGGHLIAARFNGPTDGFNLVPQDANLNRSQWRQMEEEWNGALKTGEEVEVYIQPVYTDDALRPLGFDVTYSIGGEKFHFRSFYNEAHGEDVQGHRVA